MDDVLKLGAGTLVSVLVLACATVAMHAVWSRKITQLGPTVLTTGGIFFCFTGIAWGLLDFDHSKISDSVPALLNGIRTAFWASVAGIFGALSIKIRIIMRGEPDLAENEPTGATVDDLAGLLRELNRTIGGQEDSTLLSQMKLLRADSRDQLEKLHTAFERFATTMAEQNSKALIQALSEIIRDFNTKLNEQFGDNFKQLNHAVERLLAWQIQYERQLNALIEQESRTRENMQQAAERYEALLENASAFEKTAASLGDLVQGIENQRAHLVTALQELGRLVDSAASGLPRIETQIVEMTRQIEAGVKTNHDRLAATMKENSDTMTAASAQVAKTVSDAVGQIDAKVGEMTRNIEAGVKSNNTLLAASLKQNSDTMVAASTQVAKTVTEAVGQIDAKVGEMTRSIEAGVKSNNDALAMTLKGTASALATTSAQFSRDVGTAVEKAHAELNGQVKKLNEDTNQHVMKLDAAIERELTKSIETLGRQLTALSSKFVEDYTPLTERLRRLIEVAGRVPA